LPAIVRNGGAVQDIATGKVLAQRTISPDALRAALNAIVAAGGTPMVQEGARHGDTIYLPPREESHPAAAYFEQRWRYNADRIVRLPSTPALYDVREPWWIGGAGTYAAVAQAFATLRRIAGVRSYLTGGEDYEGEYHLTGAVPETCTKAAALADYAAEHGFTLAEVLAVGDFYNDLEMIREAGFGVAMGQAPDLVKAAADAIAPDHAHDGCAVALERYILGRV